MALHPIRLVDQVIEEYRSYLLTEFRARDTDLREALLAALDRKGFLAQDPFFQAHRPFKPGKRWRDLGLDAKLAGVMEKRSDSDTAYLHQSEAIVTLLSDQARPVVVTTGTGSGKTECFLLPVIQNAIEDGVRFHNHAGLTAILVYPMNALANDQEERIRKYLEESGHTSVRVARYDRSTTTAQRAELRAKPPHLLLTNYMMLEYLLVRPSDRDHLFANHRCRFVVLDEVHSYRGALGANIALLVRRLRAHMATARQDWAADDKTDARRFPSLLPVATSATIKSIDEKGRTPVEVKALRDGAVREFLGRLTGIPPTDFVVIGEELTDLHAPEAARWPSQPVEVALPDPADPGAIRDTLAALAGLPAGTPVETSAAHAGILWTLQDLLIRRPRSPGELVGEILAQVPERQGADPDPVRREVEAALIAGAALPDGVPGALRLRTHRFIRGGWKFARCLDATCGRIYALGEADCSCGKKTAPLYICRGCGAHALRLVGGEDPAAAPLMPPPTQAPDENVPEWMLYEGSLDEPDPDADDTSDDEVLAARHGQKMKGRQVRFGSFDPEHCMFSANTSDYPQRVALAPARNRCLLCGGTAGSRDIVTPVALGTSAAVRVIAEGLVENLAEQNRDRPGHDKKERLLVFSDSRQDAAHQARFITYAGRYDRMRRNLVRLLKAKGPLTLNEAVRELANLGVEAQDNPHVVGKKNAKYLPPEVRQRAAAWEEAPLLDDLAVSAGYRATLLNLGLMGLRYEPLADYVAEQGGGLANRLGITTGQLHFLARCVLDEMRTRSALSRPLLCFHPSHPNCPEEFQWPADWERRIRKPFGYPCAAGEPKEYLDRDEIPEGIGLMTPWRKVAENGKTGGRPPAMERKVRRLLARLGGNEPSADEYLALLRFLKVPGLVTVSKLQGLRKTMELLQVGEECVVLDLLEPGDRMRCSICNVRMPWVEPGTPCPACHGTLEPWPEPDFEANRYVQRIRKDTLLPLVAREHTAQVTGDERIELEADFKAPPGVSPVNVLACSPTLEMGIDVGGLDAVVMRNVPPRPDNYSQRGGRAGRRTRVGVVLGYARNTPHDGYFFDRPDEMIAGEIPAPVVGLGNRDVAVRHLAAIVLGAAEPGLAGRMVEYVNLNGEIEKEKVEALIEAVQSQVEHAVDLAMKAWGPEILTPAGLDTPDKVRQALAGLPDHIRRVFDEVCLQIRNLQNKIETWAALGKDTRGAMNAWQLKRRLLGIPDEGAKSERDEADDRSAGYPMRRFAEFGLLPGYEFPSEPATLRLLRDSHEEEPLTVVRRFGLGQYQPGAKVFARGHRWKVKGLDPASPWNPKSTSAGWLYLVCPGCDLRFDSDQPKCPRCGCTNLAGKPLPGFEFGGFLAVREDTPVLQEEDRFATMSLVRAYPQWDGNIVGRYRMPTGWTAILRHGEEVRWVNEWKPPTPAEHAANAPYLHAEGRGFYLCPSCGAGLQWGDNRSDSGRGRKKPRNVGDRDPYGHAPGCELAGQPPRAHAIVTGMKLTTFRLLVDLPMAMKTDAYLKWGHSLGNALRTGLRQLYMLDGPEVEFELEPMWDEPYGETTRKRGALVLIDGAVGGSGFLERAAGEFHLVAARAIDHLKHEGCETACYRCLKTYQNQRIHQHLSWPHALPDLEQLAAAAPEVLPAELGDVQDPKPWLDAYAAGVGSPLELKFLRLFEKNGIEVEKQVPVAAVAGGKPISVADFVVKGKKIAIYVDGAAFHTGENLRRDRYIRQKLGDGGWKVVELVAADLFAWAKNADRLGYGTAATSAPE